MSDTDSTRTARGQALFDAHQEKLRAAFENQHFTILKEIHLAADEKFETAFGNKGRHGVILQNDETGEKLIVGNTILRRVAELYGSVELPPEQQKRKRRTKAQKEADDAAKAQEKAAQKAAQAALIEEVLNRSANETPVVPVASEETAESSDEEPAPDEADDSDVVKGLFS